MHHDFRFAIAVKIHAIEIVMRGHIAKLPLQIEHLNNLLFYQAICFLFGLKQPTNLYEAAAGLRK